MVKVKSKQTGREKKSVSFDAANRLADKLSDKPYGASVVEAEAIERLTIPLPISLYDEVEALAKKRKRAKAEYKSMAAITRQALKEYLKKHNS